jgi:PelA/Pel-15E family pectate lyase
MRISFNAFALGFVLIPFLNAAVIGTSKPAESITDARIAQLPPAQRTAWIAYLKRSQQQHQADRAALSAERLPGAPVPRLPAEASSARSIPLSRPASWYSSGEAQHIADVIVSFQTPAGGWSKNLDMTGAARLKGQSYAPDNLNKHPSSEDFDTPKDPDWNYVGTLDNDATTTEIRFLALVAAEKPEHRAAYQASIVKGIHYLLSAQFPNGGWPQVWPLEGRYHDAITYNDNAVTESAQVLTEVSENDATYAFVPKQLRVQSSTAAQHAVDCILATQVRIHGQLTIWAQQHDALTLKPTTARNYEPAALATGESADLLLYLMHLPHPSPQVVAAVQAGVAWFKSEAIYGQQWSGGRDTPGGRHLSSVAGAGPIWARVYSIPEVKPIFGDRDKTIHDDVADLSPERRNGYQWYTGNPQRALDAYSSWSEAHAPVTRASNRQ